MRTKEKLKQAICKAVDRRRVEIEKIGDQILQNPELGFKEFKTAKLVAETMKSAQVGTTGLQPRSSSSGTPESTGASSSCFQV